MRSRLIHFCVIVILAIIIGLVADTGAGSDLPPFDPDRLLDEPDHNDFPWQVWAADPYLTEQQRFLVAVRAVVDCGRLKSGELGRDMHFVLKVGNSEGHWVSEYSYTRVRVPPGLDKAFQIQYVGGIYLRPGRYMIALIAYDGMLKRRNVWRSPLTVAQLKKDPLPGLDRNLRDVEFVHETPDTYFSKGFFRYDPDWPLSADWEWLPVKNKRCLCVDIIANTSVDNDFNPSFGKARSSSHILRISSVLSHLRLNNGQIRVSVLDALRMKTLLYRQDAAGFDWMGASRMVARQNPGVIEAELLNPKARGIDYVFDMILKIGYADSCASEKNSPIKILILVSDDMELPGRTQDREEILREMLQNLPADRFLCFIAGDVQNSHLARVLKKMKPEPRVFSTGDSLAFRETLASVISSLEAID